MGNEIILRYCHATGKTLGEVLSKRRDTATLTVRNSLMYITWCKRRERITRDVKKKHVLLQIAREFGMSRTNCYEQLDCFEVNLEVNQKLRRDFEVVRTLVE